MLDQLDQAALDKLSRTNIVNQSEVTLTSYTEKTVVVHKGLRAGLNYSTSFSCHTDLPNLIRSFVVKDMTPTSVEQNPTGLLYGFNGDDTPPINKTRNEKCFPR